MKRASTFLKRLRLCRQWSEYRPALETLEDRLPPGDAIAGALLGKALIEPTVNATELISGSTAGFREKEAWARPHTDGADEWNGGHSVSAAAGGDHRGVAAGVGTGSQPQQEIHFSEGLDNLTTIDDLNPLASLDPFRAAPPRSLRQPSHVAGPAPQSTADGGRASAPGTRAPSEADAQPGPATQPLPGGLNPINQALWDGVAGLPQEIAPLQLGTGNHGNNPPPPYYAMPHPIPPTCTSGCSCSSGDEVVHETDGDCDIGNMSASLSDGGIRYADGTLNYTTNDFQGMGFGTPWGQTRSWTNGGGYSDPYSNGNGMVDTKLPVLRINGTQAAVVTSGINAQPFMESTSDSYAVVFYVQDTLTKNTSRQEYDFTDTKGDRISYYDMTYPLAQQGQLKSFTDPYGNVLVDYGPRTATGQVTEMQRTDAATGLIESYVYSYYPSGNPNAGLLKNVTMRRLPSGGQWSTIRQVDYVYYVSPDPNGNTGDLKFARIEDGSTSPNGPNVLDTKYYRYYTSTGGSGYQDGLKYVFGPESYARLVASNGGADPSNLPDSAVDPYADLYLGYDPNSQAVTTEKVQGQGASCPSCGGSGQGTYQFSYTTNPNPPSSDLFNSWKMKTVENLPDHDPNNPTLPITSQNIVYTNVYGQVLLKVYQRKVGNGPTQQWEWYAKYDSAGRVLKKANPSALSGYNDQLPDLIDQMTLGDNLYLNAFSGLIETAQYNATTGAAPGYFYQSWIQHSRNGLPILQKHVTYASSPVVGGVSVYPVGNSSVYQNAGSGQEMTSYSYNWYPGTLGIQSTTVNPPAVSAGQNGPDAVDADQTFYDTEGRPIWHRNSINLTGNTPLDGYIDYTAYDPATSAVTKTIRDVDYSKLMPSEQMSFDMMTGWNHVTGGLHLVTQMTVDTLGRTTVLTDPKGNITYTVYHDPVTNNTDPTQNDPNYEIRTYAGWSSSTGYPTGPTRVTRADRTHSPSYTETITMSAPPATSGGVPTGTEAISAIQSLTRNYINPGGQVFEIDNYFYLPDSVYSRNLNPGTVGTVNADGTVSGNYWKTLYGYDARGRQSKLQSPTGTIVRTVYDGLSRVVSSWVGTNDYHATDLDPTGGGATGNNMIQDRANTYDNGGIGDGNLTTHLDLPSGSTQAADVRETDNVYDWRNRVVVSKRGVQASEDTSTHRPLTYLVYDNLNEVTTQEQFDGDGIVAGQFLQSDGTPNPMYLSKLRAETTTGYDSQGRVYQTNVFSVNQVTGAVSTSSLQTNKWYDHRGNLIKSSEPGGLVTKMAYDGANRVTVTYKSDEIASPTWADASVITSNHVLSQTETQYDNNGNTLLVTTRDRFHNDDPTATGSLQGPSGTGPNARVSYVASYYDAADRLTTQGNIGTNQGQSYTWNPDPTTLPAGTLVTKNGYGADAVQQVSLTGSGSFTLTFKGQTTGSILSTADATTVQNALQGLSTIGMGNALVRGPVGGPWLVRFVGSALGGLNQPDMTATGTGVTVTIATVIRGGDGGRVQQVTDPRSLVTKTDYDLLGQTLRTVESFAAFVPSNATDRTTEYTYDGGGHMLTLSAVLPTSTQKTQYVYGVTGTINSNDLLAQVIYPATGQRNTESYAYNVLGEMTTKKQRNYNSSLMQPQTHTYSYDVLGRPTSDSVTVLGDGVDGAVRRLDTAYDTGGRPYLYTSYADTAGMTVVNQVQQVYNGLGQLITEYQEHSGAVVPSTSLKVQYTYSEMANGANNSRPTSMTYPNGRVVNDNYASGLDDSISRLTSLQDNGATQALEVESYLGLATVVQRAHPQANVNLTYIQQPGDMQANHDGGDQYTGLDRFGRVIDQFWVTGTGNTLDRFQYGYDRDGNVLYRANLVNHNFDELYHASGAGNGYDNFNQLTAFARGVLSASVMGGVLDTVATPTHSQGWTLDPLGNWQQFISDSTTQTRTHNVQNQITALSGATTPTYDNNGNTLFTDANGPYTYDAWNRLVHVGYIQNVQFMYDALGRRVQDSDGNTQLYYSSSWQVLEERSSGAVQAQYVWSPAYVDALVARDVGSQRLYVQQDANWNVTAVDGPGYPYWAPVERYVEDPYGTATVLNPSTWAVRTNSLYNWIYLHQGGRYDTFSGLYSFRNRDYSPTLGRWMQQDPAGYGAGDTNLYRFVQDSPSSSTDPLGLGTLKEVGDNLFYTCDCRWINTNHVGATEEASNLIEAVKRAAKSGGLVTMSLGHGFGKISQTYIIDKQTHGNQIMRIAYSIWVDISLKQEKWQLDTLEPFSHTGFSAEDLPSNQIAFYLAASRGLKDFDKNDARDKKNWEDLKKKCGGAVPDDAARKLLESLGGNLGQWGLKNFAFSPKDFNSNPAVKNCCKGPAKPPRDIFSNQRFQRTTYGWRRTPPGGGRGNWTI